MRDDASEPVRGAPSPDASPLQGPFFGGQRAAVGTVVVLAVMILLAVPSVLSRCLRLESSSDGTRSIVELPCVMAEERLGRGAYLEVTR